MIGIRYLSTGAADSMKSLSDGRIPAHNFDSTSQHLLLLAEPFARGEIWIWAFR